jgi:hypothetical protein
MVFVTAVGFQSCWPHCMLLTIGLGVEYPPIVCGSFPCPPLIIPHELAFVARYLWDARCLLAPGATWILHLSPRCSPYPHMYPCIATSGELPYWDCSGFPEYLGTNHSQIRCCFVNSLHRVATMPNGKH